jgi:glycerol-3-phosphate acyltransferase PlsY
MFQVFFYFVIFIVSYLLGSFPTAYFVVKKFTGKDIRKEGTGNVGGTNTMRATGKWYLYLLVGVVDISKAVISVLLAQKLEFGQNMQIAVALASFGVVLGHCYSIYFKLKDGKFAGGKAIACLAGITITLDFSHLFLPGITAMTLPILLTGNLFLGQFTANLAMPVIAFFLAPAYLPVFILTSIPIFFKQWSRVIPMLQGKEPKWYWRKR